ncbi:conserved Plasmodium protein, unknown function [Plasmodium berghei]|uniref:DDRGK domain-containing protein n=1 Tax=Plasmodium berghei TaxID=5821 RepID=A0A1C6YGJ8_PLABE|nr:conserved Plasmodium protein, unknown function [Plasmodium berghei]
MENPLKNFNFLNTNFESFGYFFIIINIFVAIISIYFIRYIKKFPKKNFKNTENSLSKDDFFIYERKTGLLEKFDLKEISKNIWDGNYKDSCEGSSIDDVSEITLDTESSNCDTCYNSENIKIKKYLKINEELNDIKDDLGIIDIELKKLLEKEKNLNINDINNILNSTNYESKHIDESNKVFNRSNNITDKDHTKNDINANLTNPTNIINTLSDYSTIKKYSIIKETDRSTESIYNVKHDNTCHDLKASNLASNYNNEIKYNSIDKSINQLQIYEKNLNEHIIQDSVEKDNNLCLNQLLETSEKPSKVIEARNANITAYNMDDNKIDHLEKYEQNEKIKNDENYSEGKEKSNKKLGGKLSKFKKTNKESSFVGLIYGLFNGNKKNVKVKESQNEEIKNTENFKYSTNKLKDNSDTSIPNTSDATIDADNDKENHSVSLEITDNDKIYHEKLSYFTAKAENVDVKNKAENVDVKNIDVKNKEAENVDVKNKEAENVDVKNKEAKNIDVENTDVKNIDVENKNIDRLSNEQIEYSINRKINNEYIKDIENIAQNEVREISKNKKSENDVINCINAKESINISNNSNYKKTELANKHIYSQMENIINNEKVSNSISEQRSIDNATKTENGLILKASKKSLSENIQNKQNSTIITKTKDPNKNGSIINIYRYYDRANGNSSANNSFEKEEKTNLCIKGSEKLSLERDAKLYSNIDDSNKRNSRTNICITNSEDHSNDKESNSDVYINGSENSSSKESSKLGSYFKGSEYSMREEESRTNLHVNDSEYTSIKKMSRMASYINGSEKTLSKKDLKMASHIKPEKTLSKKDLKINYHINTSEKILSEKNLEIDSNINNSEKTLNKKDFKIDSNINKSEKALSKKGLKIDSYINKPEKTLSKKGLKIDSHINKSEEILSESDTKRDCYVKGSKNTLSERCLKKGSYISDLETNSIHKEVKMNPHINDSKEVVSEQVRKENAFFTSSYKCGNEKISKGSNNELTINDLNDTQSENSGCEESSRNFNIMNNSDNILNEKKNYELEDINSLNDPSIIESSGKSSKQIKKLKEYFVDENINLSTLNDSKNNISAETNKNTIENSQQLKIYDFKHLKEKYKLQKEKKEQELIQFQNNLKNEFIELNEIRKNQKKSLENTQENSTNNIQGIINNTNNNNNTLEISSQNSRIIYDQGNIDIGTKTKPYEYTKHSTNTDILNFEKKKIDESENLKKWKSHIISKKYEEDWLSSDVLLSCFLNFIKLKKYVNIAELSVKFQTTTEDIREKLEELETLDMINGVLDEKGNYIYLSQDEINKLCLEIQTNGEVDTHEDFVNICNKIISLSINEADMKKLKEEEEKIIIAKTDIF